MGKRAVVLGGGGSRGAYQIGVWQAMKQVGMDYQIVTGSSVGALNGILMVQQDDENAKKLWENIRNEDVMDLQEPLPDVSFEEPGWERKAWGDFFHTAVQSRGVDMTPLESYLRDYVNEEAVRQSSIAFGMVTVEFPSMHPMELTIEEIPKGELADYLLASCACFPAFRTKKIGEAQFIDGGYHDNLPIQLAVRLGAQEILAVDIKGVGVYRRQVEGVPVKTIRSHWDLGPFLLFDPTLSKRNMRLGYLEALRAFGQLEGNWYSWPLGMGQKMAPLAKNRILQLAQVLKLDEKDGPMASIMRRKLLKVLLEGVQNKQRGKELPWGLLAQLTGELAGECFKIPPLKIYTFATLGKEVVSRFHQWEKELDFQKVLEIQEKGLPPLEQIKRIAGLGRIALVSFLYQELKKAMAGGSLPLTLWPGMALFPKDFLVVAFLWAADQDLSYWEELDR